MKLAFLYPSADPRDALPLWVAALARHCREHRVVRATSVAGCAGCDAVLALTQREKYPPAQVGADLQALRAAKVPYGVLHNQDNPPVPLPGDYPNFVWTFAQRQRLKTRNPWLVRMPVLPLCVPCGVGSTSSALVPRHVATFGRVEPKKHTLQMAQRCKALGVEFSAFTPFLEDESQGYHDRVRKYGRVCAHPWAEKVEDLAYLFGGVSHFLFVLPPGKGGSGGSPTSCRYATAFGRPVVVVDDENTYALDGFAVLKSLAELSVDVLRQAELPNYDWLPDRYVEAVGKRVLEHWARA